MKRNKSIDFLKGVLCILVILLHIQTFIIGANAGYFILFFYSMASITVPLFFLISGYFFMLSKNNKQNFYNLLIYYIIYTIFTCLFAIKFLDYNFSFVSFIGDFFILGYQFGYIWFIKYLLIFQMFAYVFIKKGTKHLQIIFIFYFIISILYIIIFNDTTLSYVSLLSAFIIGMLLVNVKTININPIYLLSLFLLPFILAQSYDIYNIIVLLYAVLIFLIFKDLNFSQNPLQLFSKNTANILFVQYFVFKTLTSIFSIQNSILQDNYVICTIIVFVLILFLLSIYIFIEIIILKIIKSIFYFPVR